MKNNLELVGVMTFSSLTSLEQVKHKLILALDPSKVSYNTVMKNNLELVCVMAFSSPTSLEKVKHKLTCTASTDLIHPGLVPR